MLSQEQRARIIEQESKAFLDEGFGQLDLSSFPSLQNAPTEEFSTEDKHGLSRVDVSGMSRTNKLRELIENPDRAALAELAKEDPALAAQLAEDRATEIARQFVADNPQYLRTDRNFERIVDFLLRKHFKQSLRNYPDPDAASMALLAAGVWTVPELSASFKKLYREGELDTASNEPRFLTPTEKLRCEQLAANGEILTAICDYVQYRIGEDAADQVRFGLADPLSFTADPANREILEEAVLWCWQRYRKDFWPTPERLEFLKQYAAGRFLTVALLDAGFETLKLHERDATRSGLLSQVRNSQSEQPTPAAFDEMSDEQIADLKRRTLREYAKQFRRR